MTGFLDISYGNVFLRNSNLFIKSADASLGGRLFVAGDMSLSGRLYAPINSIPANAIIGGGGATFTNTTGTFASNNSVVTMTLDTSAANTLDISGFMSVSQAFGVGVTNPQYQVDVGGGQIGCGRMAQFGTGGAPFTPGNNITTNIIVGQFTGPLSTTADTSLNGRLFVLGDTSKNGMLFVGADTSLNGRLFVKADASLNGNLNLGGNLVVNGNLTVNAYTQSSILNTITTNKFSVNEDLSLNGNAVVSGNVRITQANSTVAISPFTINNTTNAVNSLNFYPYLNAGNFNPVVSTTNDSAFIWGSSQGSATAGLAFAPWSSSTTGLRIASTGNVSINTTTATKALNVGGDALINGLTVGLGAGALASNTAIGVSALNANTTGTNNAAVGINSLAANTTGGTNTAVGLNSLRNNTTASSNTAVGGGALESNTTGSNNTAVGSVALYANTTGTENVAIGQGALQNNTNNANTAAGFQALINNTSGSSNAALGHKALLANTTGANNTASGQAALQNNTTSNNNSAFGQAALYSNTTGNNNTAVGQSALQNNTTAGQNSAFGQNALNSVTTGATNTALGYNAGNTGIPNTTGSSNTYLGYNTGSSANNWSNSTAIGAGASITASNQIVLGTSTEKVVIPGTGINFTTTGSGTTNSPLCINHNPILLRGSTDGNHGLCYGNSYYINGSSTFGIDGPALYGAGGGILGTNANGTLNTALTWKNSGNVGIGTTAPSCPLDVFGSSRVYNSTNDTGLTVNCGNGTFATIEAMNNANTTKRNVCISAYGGNVGIGTTNPQAALDVSGAIRVSGGITTTYSTLPTFTSGQVGYVYENNSFTAYTAVNTWLSLASITVPAGVYVASASYCLLYGGGSYGALGTTATDAMEFQQYTPGIRNAINGIFVGPTTIYVSYNATNGATSSALETARSRFRVVRIA